MTCPRCAADPQPANFGSPRKCAFDPSGNFTPENWNCATLNALLVDHDWKHTIHGDDESMNLVYCREEPNEDGFGWLVFTRYKRRGCCSSALHVGDFWPPRPLTLEFAEKLLAVKTHGPAYELK